MANNDTNQTKLVTIEDINDAKTIWNATHGMTPKI